MADTINIPISFVAGINISWTDTYEDWPASEYELTYTFVNQSETISLVATASGDSHVVEILPASFTGSGKYKYQIMARLLAAPNTVSIVGYGEVMVSENYANTVGGLDTRCIQEKLLDQINTLLLEDVGDESQKIAYQDMEVWSHDRQGLYDFRDKLQRELTLIKQKKRRKFCKNLRYNLRG